MISLTLKNILWNECGTSEETNQMDERPLIKSCLADKPRLIIRQSTWSCWQIYKLLYG